MATSNTSPVMQLPIDLFPVHAKDYTMAWAKNTYEYAHIFMENVNAAIYDSLKDVELWKQHAILLCSIIMKQGAIEAKKYMVYLAQKKFKITPPTRQTPVSSYNEIMSVIQTPAWYNSDTNERRKEIYLMVYGCYRRGKNDWALSWCNEWKKNIILNLLPKKKIQGKAQIHALEKSASTKYSLVKLATVFKIMSKALCLVFTMNIFASGKTKMTKILPMKNVLSTGT